MSMPNMQLLHICDIFLHLGVFFACWIAWYRRMTQNERCFVVRRKNALDVVFDLARSLDESE